MQAQYKICVSVIWGMQQRTKGPVNFQELAQPGSWEWNSHATLHPICPAPQCSPRFLHWTRPTQTEAEVAANGVWDWVCVEVPRRACWGRPAWPDCPRNKSPDHAHTNRITTITTTRNLSCWRGPLEGKIFTHTKSGESPRVQADLGVCVFWFSMTL